MQRLYASRRNIFIQFRKKMIELTGFRIPGDLPFPFVESRRFFRHETLPEFLLLIGGEAVDLLKDAFDGGAHSYILSEMEEDGKFPPIGMAGCVMRSRPS